jgi:hypothetical protein
MSGPKRNPDKLNTIGVVVVGICGAVMVYVSIIALQAFYMNDTSELQHTKDYGGMERTAQGHKADELRNISEAGTNTGAPTFHIPVDHAIDLVVEDAKKDPSHLIPSRPASTKATIEPVFGRPKPLGGAAPAPEAGAGSAAAPAQGSGAAPAQGSGAAPAGQGSGAGSAAPAGTMKATPTNPAGASGTAAPQTPTGAGTGGGAGASPSKDAATPTAAGSASKTK